MDESESKGEKTKVQRRFSQEHYDRLHRCSEKIYVNSSGWDVRKPR